MSTKALVGLVVLILTLNCSLMFNNFATCQVGLQAKYYVDDDYDSVTPGWGIDHFSKIQDAINKLESDGNYGDRIVVYNGTYNEDLTINHPMQILGEDRDITIINGTSSADTIEINANNIKISHFTIKSKKENNTNSLIRINNGNTIVTDNKIIQGNHGINIQNCDSNTIYDNIISNNSGDGLIIVESDRNNITYNTITYNKNGTYLDSSSYNEFNNNDISLNNQSAIYINKSSTYNGINNNTITENTLNGIFLNDNCNRNEIFFNSLEDNSDSGIRIENSSYNLVRNNTIDNNINYGLLIVGSNNWVYNCEVKNNKDGMLLFADDNSKIFNNTIETNDIDGIRLINSTDDRIYNNTISKNSRYGINADYFTTSNIIYNNKFWYNTYNAVDKSINVNYWNLNKTHRNIVGGDISNGNYWTNYDEESEGAVDINNDDIADTGNFTINGRIIKDYHPILDPTPPEIGTPSATPSTQTIGSNTYIKASILDNLEVKEVYLIITDPNNQTSNFSIKQNQTGDIFYCNKQFSPYGEFTYYIAAKDTRHWDISDNKTFIIDAGTAPTITDNTATTGSVSGYFLFNATIVDDVDSPTDLDAEVIWTQAGYSGTCDMKHAGNNRFIGHILELKKTISPLKYRIRASDKHNNIRETDEKTVTINDSESPEIIIIEREYFYDGVIKTFTIGAKITDNHKVEDAKIEYWYGDVSSKIADLDEISDEYYEKTIQIEPEVNRVYCILNATDPSGNEIITNNPYANSSGPYRGVINLDISFNGSNSFDLDGDILNYTWNFGDGTTGSGIIVQHSYSTNDNYTVTLTVTDNDDNTDTDTTYANIIQSTKLSTTDNILDEINDNYGTSLNDLFYSYDIDGDEKVDIFVDPNNILKPVHDGSINISNNIVFLLSIDENTIPEFMWNTTTNTIHTVSHKIGIAEGDPDIDISDSIVIQDISINKTNGWIYLEVPDPDIGDYGTISGIINVTKNNTIMIDDDKIIRKNSKTYILDDPVINYRLVYSYKPPTLQSAIFNPKSGSNLDENNHTITVEYNVAVTIIDAAFYTIDPVTTLPLDNGTNIDIKNQFVTSDNKKYNYTPPKNLEEGYYEIYLFVRQKNTTKTLDSSARYNYIPYSEEKMQLTFSTILMMLGSLILVLAAIYGIIKYKNMYLESFVYIKNKKIIPFFKPIIFGPLKIDVNDEKVSKAEFYLNGELKDTITEGPYIWKLDEPMFNRQKIETKIYDENGNSSSSGEISFFVFNPPKIFK